MNNKKTIIITAIVTALVIIGGLYLYYSEQLENQTWYNIGYAEGSLYTQQTGNIVFNNNGTLEEKTIYDVCNILIEQQINSDKKG